MSAQVFRVELTLEIQPGREQEFEKTWLSVGQLVSEHPNNLSQSLSASREAPGRYRIISDWTDEENFRRYEQSDKHAQHIQRLRELRARGTMELLTVLHTLPGAATR
jgi:heme-degrading monooxygenase HmoA